MNPRQQFYNDLVAGGTDPKFAESLAAWRRFPGSPPLAALGASGTEQAFFEATADPLGGCHPFHRQFMLDKLKANGVSDLNGKRYMPGLAAYAGDPRAVVGSRTDMRKVLEERGWASEGLVNTRLRERDQPLTHESGPYACDPQLVRDRIAGMEATNPELAVSNAANPAARADLFDSLSADMSGQTGLKKRRPESFEHIHAEGLPKEAYHAD